LAADDLGPSIANLRFGFGFGLDQFDRVARATPLLEHDHAEIQQAFSFGLDDPKG
jgi:hypothetical protein